MLQIATQGTTVVMTLEVLVLAPLLDLRRAGTVHKMMPANTEFPLTLVAIGLALG